MPASTVRVDGRSPLSLYFVSASALQGKYQTVSLGKLCAFRTHLEGGGSLALFGKCWERQDGMQGVGRPCPCV